MRNAQGYNSLLDISSSKTIFLAGGQRIKCLRLCNKAMLQDRHLRLKALLGFKENLQQEYGELTMPSSHPSPQIFLSAAVEPCTVHLTPV